MMREIKFRAWDKKEMQMIYQGDNSTQINGVMDCQISFDMMGHAVFVRYYGEDNSHEIKETELMQYTGLKDVNGKEIYEGDIVRYQFDNDDCPFPNKHTEKIIGRIFFSEHRASFSVTAGKNCSDMLNNNLFKYVRNGNRVEVIGNIYENPELLEG